MISQSHQNVNGAPDPRIVFAAERTLLAWVRTGLAAMGFGFVVARFGLFLRELATVRNETPTPGHGGSLWLGVVLVFVGVVVLILAGLQYRRYIAALMADQNAPTPTSNFGLIIAGLLAVIGLAMAIYLLSVA